MIVAGVCFALAGTCFYALAATLQHHAVNTVTPNKKLNWSHARVLISRPAWLIGLVAQCFGAALHVVALSLAPLTVVQPLGVLGISLTVLFTALTRRALLDRWTAIAVTVTTIGVGLFVLLSAHGVTGEVIAIHIQMRVLWVGVGPVVGLILLGWRARDWMRCPLLATAAGTSFGVVSALIRAVAAGFRGEGITSVSVVSIVGIVVAAVVGGWCLQQAYASGRPDTVMACQTVVDPLCGVLVGSFFFGEATNLTGFTLIGELMCALLVVVGVITLARRRVSHASIGRAARINAVEAVNSLTD